MPRVTEDLRRQWTNQRTQMFEERTHDQSGRPRPLMDVALVDFDIKVMDALLALPLGARFDSREVQEQIRATMREFDPEDTPTTEPAPAAGPVTQHVTQPVAQPVIQQAPAPRRRDYGVPGLRLREASETTTFDVEVQTTEDEPWTVKAAGFADETEAWEFIEMMRKKPVWAPCLWRVTEVRRKTTGAVWGPAPDPDEPAEETSA